MERVASLCLCACLWLLLAVSVMSGGENDSQGRTFILGFLENWEADGGVGLYFTTFHDTEVMVTVTAPLWNASWQETIFLSRGSGKSLKLPASIRGSGIKKDNKGVFIEATEEISVLVVNSEPYYTDAYLALPVDVLGQEYYAVTYIRNAELMVVAVVDNTEVLIRWPDNTAEISIPYLDVTYGNGETLILTLNKFETFHAIQEDDASDFTGAFISADQPIAVISGNRKAAVPETENIFDHLTEMMIPVYAWGKTFYTTQTPDQREGDVFRIVASTDNTPVTVDGGSPEPLSKAGSFEDKDLAFVNSLIKITADDPIMIVKFAKSFQSEEGRGDPSMSLLIPTLQYAPEYTWSSVTDATGAPFSSKVSVVIDKTKQSGLRLDGRNDTWENEEDVGTSMVHLVADVGSGGTHEIMHDDPSVSFMVALSGKSGDNAYSTLAGMRVSQINPCSITETVAGDNVDNDCDGFTDEEKLNEEDDDDDGDTDEDLAKPPRVDGSWGCWGNFGECSEPCGRAGNKTRTRACDDPAPVSHGRYCPGSDTETVDCDISDPCPASMPTQNCTDEDYLPENGTTVCVCSVDFLGDPPGWLEWIQGNSIVEDGMESSTRELQLPSTYLTRQHDRSQIHCRVNNAESQSVTLSLNIAYGPDKVDLVQYLYYDTNSNSLRTIFYCQVSEMNPVMPDMAQWEGPCRADGFTCTVHSVGFNLLGTSVRCRVTNYKNNNVTEEDEKPIGTSHMTPAGPPESVEQDQSSAWPVVATVIASIAVPCLSCMIAYACYIKSKKKVNKNIQVGSPTFQMNSSVASYPYR